MKNLAVNVLLRKIIIEDNVGSIAPGKQLIRPIGSWPVALLETQRNRNKATYVSDQEEAPVGCKTALLTVKPARTKAPVMMRIPIAGLHMVKTHPHLIQRRVDKVAESPAKR